MVAEEAKNEVTGGWQTAWAVLLACSLWLITFNPEKSLLHQLGIVACALSAVVQSRKNYLLIPALIILFSSLLGAVFGYLGTMRAPIIIISSLAVPTAAYGWWKDKRAKTIAKRQNHRP